MSKKIHFSDEGSQSDEESTTQADDDQLEYPEPDSVDFPTDGGLKRTRAFAFTYFPAQPEGIMKDTTPVGYHTVKEMATARDVHVAHQQILQQIQHRIFDEAVMKQYKVTVEKLLCFIAAPEIAPTTKSPHYQGYVHFEKPVSFAGMKKRLSMVFDPNRIYVRPALGSAKQNLSYIEGPYKKGSKFKPANIYCIKHIDPTFDINKKVEKAGNAYLAFVQDAIHGGLSDRELVLAHPDQFIRHYKGAHAARAILDAPVLPPPPSIRLYPWQEHLFNVLKDEEPIKRRIFWIYSSLPGVGKSEMLEYIQCSDIGAWDAGSSIPAWDNFVQSYPQKAPRIILFDIPRTYKFTDESYGLLETLSNMPKCRPGHKYQSRAISVCAHVVVFTNTPPPLEELPKRLVIYSVDKPPAIQGVFDYMVEPLKSSSFSGEKKI